MEAEIGESEDVASPTGRDHAFDVGSRLRQVRMQRSLSVTEVARLSGLTRSFLSQVENGRVSPSVASLQKIVTALDMTLSALFARPAESRPLVRKRDRPRLHYAGTGVDEELLSPSLAGKLQVMWTRIDPGGGSGYEDYTHDADEECIVVIRGGLEVTVEGQVYSLEEGDAITFGSRLPHHWHNAGDCPAECVWIITPPRY